MMSASLNVARFLDRRSAGSLVAGLGLVAALGYVDYLTGYEVSFAVFYLVPVMLVTWRAGATAGILTSILSAAVWDVANILAGQTYGNPLIPYWNTATRLAFFVVVALILSRLRDALHKERAAARTDFLTGALTGRAFFEIATAEIDRMRRYPRPLTLVYIDADGFKAVNDSLGHNTGDRLLRAAGQAIAESVRVTDRVARLGGDEFALLLPETGPDAALAVVEKVRGRVAEMMRDHGWTITFSYGILTCTTAPPGVDDMIRMADDLMYAAKKAGKDARRSSVYGGMSASA